MARKASNRGPCGSRVAADGRSPQGIASRLRRAQEGGRIAPPPADEEAMVDGTDWPGHRRQARTVGKMPATQRRFLGGKPSPAPPPTDASSGQPRADRDGSRTLRRAITLASQVAIFVAMRRPSTKKPGKYSGCERPPRQSWRVQRLFPRAAENGLWLSMRLASFRGRLVSDLCSSLGII